MWHAGHDTRVIKNGESPSYRVAFVIAACITYACESDFQHSEGASPTGSSVATTSSSASGGAGGDLGAPPDICAKEACGGDLVGTWEFQSPCQPPRPPPTDSCGNTLDEPEEFYFQTRVEGTIEFRPDGTDIGTTRLAHLIMFDHPVDCLPPGVTCQDHYAESWQCVTHDGLCDCVADESEAIEMWTESYKVEGNQLTFVDTEGEESVVTYCVEGGWLRYWHEGAPHPETLRRID